ncbi:CDGSH iron-sulfur domain-containing protein [Streptomyces sp. NPDC052236]|uniref:CDGSH iron-sulfur domain-containing protein n=1 Tax=Streptomyces sp. NPDC052236 TaxID=3365686 RepID=UPI0037D38606
MANSCGPEAGPRCPRCAAQDGQPPPEAGSGPAAPRSPEPRRVVIDPDGPILIEGPVEVVLADGRTVSSDRFMIALCACRRSGTYPWCDSSHRRRPPAGSPRQGPPQ